MICLSLIVGKLAEPDINNCFDLFVDDMSDKPLAGPDNTNNEDMKEDNISITDTEITITGLKDDTAYEFYLFVTNTMGEFDEDTFMKIEKKTSSSHSTAVFLIIPLVITLIMLAVPVMTCLVAAVLRLTRRQHTMYRFTSLREEEVWLGDI